MPKYTVERLKLADLVLDPELQFRAPESGLVGLVDPQHLESLVKAIKARRGDVPRPKVRRVPGRGDLVTDGFHTVTARRLVNPDGSCDCDVAEGQWLDAVIDAGESNHQHDGAPKKYTRADKRRAVTQMLKHLKVEGKKWTAGALAEKLHVSDEFVRLIIKELQAKEDATAPDPEQEATGKGGKKVKPKKPAPNVGGTNGKPAKIPFNWQVASAEMGLCQRMPDRLKEKAPGVEGTTEFAAYVRILGELAEAFDRLKKAHAQHKPQEK